VRVTSSEHEETSRTKRDVDDNSGMNDDEDDRSKRLPRLGARAPLPRLGLLRSVDKRLPRMGRQRRLHMSLSMQTQKTTTSTQISFFTQTGDKCRLRDVQGHKCLSTRSIDSDIFMQSAYIVYQIWVDNDVYQGWGCVANRFKSDYRGWASVCRDLGGQQTTKISGAVRCCRNQPNTARRKDCRV